MVYSQIMNSEPIPPVLCRAYNKALMESDPEAFEAKVYSNLTNVITGEIKRVEAEDYGQ